MKILIVDDDDVVRQLILKILKSENYEVIQAVNGKDALNVLTEQKNIQLVITDLIMPEMEGIETINHVKKEFPHIKILAISGGGKGSPYSYLNIAKRLGADSTLSKPFVKQQLLDAINELDLK